MKSHADYQIKMDFVESFDMQKYNNADCTILHELYDLLQKHVDSGEIKYFNIIGNNAICDGGSVEDLSKQDISEYMSEKAYK